MTSAYVQRDEDVEAVKFPSIVNQSQAGTTSTEPTVFQSEHFTKHSLSEKMLHNEWSRQGNGSLFHKHNKTDSDKVETHGALTTVSLPEEATKVATLYSQRWNERKRNKFLLKIVLSLDPRQIYFLSKFLSVKQEKDIVGLLPENLALKILAGLRPRDLLAACMVSKQWERLASNNSLWKLKSQDVNVVVPVPPDPDWKIVFRDNYMLRLNWRRGRCETAEFVGHSDSVQCVTCDTERIASGSADKTIRVWDIKTKELLHVLKGHTKGVWCLQFFTRHLLVSGSFDNTIRIWNLRTGLTTRTLFGHEGQIWCLKIRGPLLVSGSQDKTAKLWDIGRCLLLGTLSGHSAAVFNVDTSEDNKMVLTASGDKTVRLWSADTFQLVKCVWVSPSTSVMTVSYCQGYFACSYDGTVCLYKGTKLVRTFNEHRKRVESLKLKMTDADKGEGHITSAGQDGLIKHWDVTQDDSLQTYKGHQQPINCIFVDDLRIATASTDHSVKLLNFNVGVSSRRETKRK
ncbi:unnamed protein product [Lymnaea stagnalis]|uniref:F-box domain-containing protein n=1 Tax=Lymnaea stagnalis TaxID=6523 RepID=A0AAV2I3E6_LYMST